MKNLDDPELNASLESETIVARSSSKTPSLEDARTEEFQLQNQHTDKFEAQNENDLTWNNDTINSQETVENVTGRDRFLIPRINQFQ